MQVRYSAGGPIVSYCTKCKQSLDHIITLIEERAISKVRCRTCGGVHKYRDPATVKPPRQRKGQDGTTAVMWQACMAKARGKELLYNIAGRYRVGDIVVHEKFGKGVVRKLASNRCHVIFEDKERLMASAN